MSEARRFEDEQKTRRHDIEVAMAAYNAVWDSWPTIDAKTVEDCRRVAMAAAIGALSQWQGER